MSKHAKVLEFINNLVEKYGKGGYIFRGTSKRYSEQDGKSGIRDGINSNLYRWALKGMEDGGISQQKKIYRDIFTNNPYFYPANMEKEIVEKAARLFPSNTENHEVLTELQHFGGKTNMIDFSRSMYIALFFACQGNQGNPEESGELIALHESKLKKINKIDYSKSLKKGMVEAIDPAGTQDSRQRVNFQGSTFVRPADGYINPNLCDIEEITFDIKEPILEYLRVFHNIIDDTVYNDLHGFIKNEKNNETTDLCFYSGLAKQKIAESQSTEQGREDCEKAIEYFTECLKRNPNLVSVYNNRGNAYSFLGKYKLALDDLNNAISRNPNDARSYNNRAAIHSDKGDLEKALQDYNKAILLNSQYMNAYASRGYVYYRKDEYERAIKDYSKAISIDSNFAFAYHFRGLAKEKINDREGAKADFAKAKELGFVLPESPPPEEE